MVEPNFRRRLPKLWKKNISLGIIMASRKYAFEWSHRRIWVNKNNGKILMLSCSFFKTNSLLYSTEFFLKQISHSAACLCGKVLIKGDWKHWLTSSHLAHFRVSLSFCNKILTKKEVGSYKNYVYILLKFCPSLL